MKVMRADDEVSSKASEYAHSVAALQLPAQRSAIPAGSRARPVRMLVLGPHPPVLGPYEVAYSPLNIQHELPVTEACLSRDTPIGDGEATWCLLHG